MASIRFKLLSLTMLPLCLVVWPPLADGGGGFEEDKADYAKAIERKRRFDSDLYPPTVTARQMYCYSCMSRRLQDSWEGVLWQFFRRPEHFTESCDPDHFRRGIVKLRNCTDHCIWLITETQVFGQKIPVYTRGCMSDVLNYRQDAVRKLRSGDFCVRRQLSELYNDGDKKFMLNEIVTLCACHSNYCNGARQFDRSWITIIFLQLLIASGFWRCYT